MGSFEDSPIMTERLALVLLGRTVLEDALAGRPVVLPDCTGPADLLVGAEDVVRLRLAQLDADPAIAPWLLRAIVLRDARIAVGFIGCHAEPDARGMVELGYEIHPAHRRRGYASEAALGLMTWAASQGVRIARLSVSPDNGASLAIASRLGFVRVGEQMDEVDGLELVFEKSLEDGVELLGGWFSRRGTHVFFDDELVKDADADAAPARVSRAATAADE